MHTLRSLTTAPRGSYRLEHVLEFLQRHLPAWSEARAAAGDYRLLFLDAYAAHLDQQVADLAWSRGFIVVYHGGCTTGVCQVNDTDLHAALEAMYLECEAIAFHVQQEVDLCNISRSRQQATPQDGLTVCTYARTCVPHIV